MRRAIVKNRNRFDVKVFWPGGQSLRWTSNEKKSLTPTEMVTGLKKIIAVIETIPDSPAPSEK